jgi:ABC-type phosphate transport system substrate-binding protein
MTARLLAIAGMAIFLLTGLAKAEGLLIIANPSVNVATPLSLSQVAAIYLLRVAAWPEGSHIVPVNREATSEAREKFTSNVLRRDNADLAAYWNEMHFMGKQPPVVQESERAMLAFIQNVPGSIGYVSASVSLANVKVLAYVP